VLGILSLDSISKIKSSEIGLFSAITIGNKLESKLELNSEIEMEKTKHRNKLRYRNKNKINNENLNTVTTEENLENELKVKNLDVQNNKNNLSLPLQNNSDIVDITHQDIEEKSIYFEGWVKYLKFRDSPSSKGGPSSKINKPKQFYKNVQFDVQTKFLQNKNIKQSKENSDENGILKYIPSELHFYTVLYKKGLNIFSSRDDTFQRSIDILNIDDIKPIPEANNYIGGVRDFGKFSEGACFRVLTKESLEPFTMSVEKISPTTGIDRKWVFCFNEEAQKIKLMNLIIKLRLKRQHSFGVYVELNKDGDAKEGTENNNIKEMSNNNSLTLNQPTNGIDGYWVLIKDWGECTLKCGGGKQYQQMSCNQPKADGKPCEGPSIRTRPCNMDACPSVVGAAKEINQEILAKVNVGVKSGFDNGSGVENRESLPPVFKMMAVSKRLSRYDKCVIKEGDALFVIKEKNIKKISFLTKVPVRIILNDRTFSIFGDDVKIFFILAFF
jgi:hypothetical protein